MLNSNELQIHLQDTEWPYIGITHDRLIVRAIVLDKDGLFYFVRAFRDDEFGKVTLIETSGGGVEGGEDLQCALKRELKEELGADVDILCKIGTVDDFYHLIRRHNINHYYLCRVKAFYGKNLTQDEVEKFHLSTLCMRYEDAIEEYKKRASSGLGKLIANRELPVLQKAKELLDSEKLFEKNRFSEQGRARL